MSNDPSPAPGSPAPAVASIAIALLSGVCGGLGTPVATALMHGGLHGRGLAMTAAETIPSGLALLGGLVAAVLGAWATSTSAGGARAMGCAGLFFGLVLVLAAVLWIASVSVVAAYT